MHNRASTVLLGIAGTTIAVVLSLIGFTSGTQSGFNAQINSVASTAVTATAFTCQVAAQPALATVADATDAGTAAAPGPKACPRDPGSGFTPELSSRYLLNATAVTPSLTRFTEEIWFKTTSRAGGPLIAVADNGSANNGQNGHVLYLTDSGSLVFGVARAGGHTTLTGGQSLTDGGWHQAIAVLGPTGMSLYVDGTLAASNSYTRTPPGSSAVWMVGYGSTTGWPADPGAAVFPGVLRYASVYGAALGSADITTHYAAGR